MTFDNLSYMRWYETEPYVLKGPHYFAQQLTTSLQFR